MTNIRVQAKYVVPVDQPPIENGVVEIRDGLIVSVEKSNTRSDDLIDLGQVTILPGLVNAHTHLEFSGIERPLGDAGMNFADWIAMVIGIRRNTPESDKRSAIAKGILECERFGTVAIGEIGTAPLISDAYQTPMHVSLFFERLGIRSEQADETTFACSEFLASPEAKSIAKAISPHAPYSVHPKLLENLIDLSCQSSVPVAMHLAESKDELLMLDKQQGKFVDLLQSLDLWSDNIYSKGTVPLDLIKSLSRCPNCLIIHGNYLSAAEIEYVARHRETMSVVYCPRTHDYFGHDPYPLDTLLAANINVAIGTDSRASNPDLNLFAEMKLVRSTFPDLPQQKVLEMGTINGAHALQIANRFGAIRAGTSGLINVVNNDYSELFTEQTVCLPLSRYLKQ